MLALAADVLAPHAADAGSRYVGTYATTRPGADSTQALTLVLESNGHATLTTRFPDLEQRVGPGVLPVRQSGTWREQRSAALVHLTSAGLLRDGKIVRSGRAKNDITFSLQGCRLIAARYSKIAYGEAGLTFDKSNCRG